MICPLMSNADKRTKCLENECGLYVSDADENLLGCAYAQSVVMMTHMTEVVYDLFDGITAGTEEQLKHIAQGCAYIPDIC